MSEKAFIKGFADTTGLELGEACEQWAAFSRQLSDKEIERVERRGYKSGAAMGKDFNRLYPKEGNDG